MPYQDSPTRDTYNSCAEYPLRRDSSVDLPHLDTIEAPQGRGRQPNKNLDAEEIRGSFRLHISGRPDVTQNQVEVKPREKGTSEEDRKNEFQAQRCRIQRQNDRRAGREQTSLRKYTSNTSATAMLMKLLSREPAISTANWRPRT